MKAGKVAACAIALTNLGATPLLADAAAKALIGQTPDEKSIGAAVAAHAPSWTAMIPAAPIPKCWRHLCRTCHQAAIARRQIEENSHVKVHVKLKINGRNGTLCATTHLLVHFCAKISPHGTHIGCGPPIAAPVRLTSMAVGKILHHACRKAQGAEVTTIEGWPMPWNDGSLRRLPPDAASSAACTGMIVPPTGCSRRTQSDRRKIRFGIAGNLCRCTGYQNIVKAIQHAAAKLRGEEFLEAAE
jgi:carbon-monoxide dehydrogenase small subunit